MRCHWLQRSGQTDCILFMAGWGMDPNPFAGIPCPGHDLLMLFDYRDLAPPDLSMLADYQQCRLIAWSMGVWVAANMPPGFRSLFAHATAIGGTLHPVDDRRGIPVAALDTTLHTLDHSGLEAFHRSMFCTGEEEKRFLDHAPCRTPAELRAELACLTRACRQGPGNDIYDLRIVTSRDRVFPARNQVRAWGRKAAVTRRWPHFPFYQVPAWPHLAGSEDQVDRP